MILQSLMETASAATAATELLCLDELSDFIDHLGEGTLDELRRESWFRHVSSLVPTDISADSIHTLWVLLIDIHAQRSAT